MHYGLACGAHRLDQYIRMCSEWRFDDDAASALVKAGDE
jgi:hypothetical protein